MEEKEIKFKTLANDIVFKSIFFKDEELLKWLMERTFKSLNLNYSINNFNIRNGELVVDRVFLRSRTLDVLIESDDIVYNLEVNKYFNKEITLRNYLYQSNYLIFMVHKGKDYLKSIKPVVQINYNVNTSIDNEYNGRYKEMEVNSYKEYPKIKEIINIDIAKYMDKWYNLNKDKEYYEKYKHFLLIGMTEEDLKELEDDDIMVKKIKNEIFNLNNPSEFPRLFTDEEFLEIEKNTSYNSGVEKGIEQGTINTNINNAKRMKKEKIPFDVIKRITGLDINTISML